jgi:predicted acylesterase/phospholipase RssA
MSISIPLYYTPIKYKNNYYIDAGCCDNFPVDIFENRSNEVIGIKLSSQDKTKLEINNLFDYIKLLARVFISNKKKQSHVFYKKIIQLDCSRFSMLNYNMSDDEKNELFELGYIQTKQQFE